jgi:uncharacterized protein YhbP (UPF0306 family)
VVDLKELIQEHLKNERVMQLATSIDNKPWVCNVHFYADDKLNVYWASTPERRHSKDIEQNSHIAIAIKIHEDTPDERYVIGLSAEGNAHMLSVEEAERIEEAYVNKIGTPPALLNDIKEGKIRFYRLKSVRFVLFDTKNFPENPRQEYAL